MRKINAKVNTELLENKMTHLLEISFIGMFYSLTTVCFTEAHLHCQQYRREITAYVTLTEESFCLLCNIPFFIQQPWAFMIILVLQIYCIDFVWRNREVTVLKATILLFHSFIHSFIDSYLKLDICLRIPLHSPSFLILR